MDRKKIYGLLLAALLIVFPISISVAAVDGGEKSQETVGEDTAATYQIDWNQPGPVIYFPDSVHNFGEVKQLTTLIHNFKVINRGSEPLKIDKVKAS